MKIAIIHSNLDGRGGSQRYAIEIAKEFKNSGNDVDIYAYHYDKSCYPELIEGLKVNAVYENETMPDMSKLTKKIIASPLYKLWIVLGLDFLAVIFDTSKNSKKIASIIGNNYDIIFAHEEPLSVWAATEIKKKYNIPVAWFCYDTILKWYVEWPKQEMYRNPLRKFILKHIFFKFDRIKIDRFVDRSYVLDTGMKKKFKSLYNSKPKIQRGGISTNEIFTDQRLKKIHEKYNLKHSTKIISCVSRFLPYKRIDDLILAYSELDESIRNNTVLYINAPIADKFYYNQCRKLSAESKSPKRIIIDTEISPSENNLLEIYSSTDVFVFPNEKQTWGHAPIEAMAHGVIAIVSDETGISELIRKISPYVYKCKNIKELTQKLSLALLKNHENKQIVKKQYELIKYLSWERICQDYISDFRDIIKK